MRGQISGLRLATVIQGHGPKPIVSPFTHLLGSWLVATAATDNPRDRRLATLAGVLPDLDGLGLIVDGLTRATGAPPTFLYERYHHFLLHGLGGGLLLAVGLAAFARRPLRVGLTALVVFHLHLACDLVGSRGPDPIDLWPIFYLGPWTKDPMWLWHGQWRLDGWPNRLISLGCFVTCLALAVRRGHSFVGVFSPRLDVVFVGVLRGWAARLGGVGAGPAPPGSSGFAGKNPLRRPDPSGKDKPHEKAHASDRGDGPCSASGAECPGGRQGG